MAGLREQLDGLEAGARYGDDERRAAVHVQRHVRGRAARKSVAREREQITKIQALQRGKAARRRLSLSQDGGVGVGLSADLALADRVRGSTDSVGSHGITAELEAEERRNPRADTVDELRGEMTERLLDRQSAAVRGQDVTKRGYASSRRALAEDTAARRIQARYRGWQARDDVARMRERVARMQSSAFTQNVGGGSSIKSRALASIAAAAFAGDWAAAGAGARSWESFAMRQRARYVPLTPGGLQTITESSGYRMRVLRLDGMPVPRPAREAVARGSAVEARVTLSLFDESFGCFFGCTCSSLPTVVDASGETFAVDLQSDFYFHSRVADSRCLLVVELVLMETHNGAPIREFSAGWAPIPLQGPAQGAGANGMATAPVHKGTPRYLLWMRERRDPPAFQVRDAVVTHQLEPFPALMNCANLFPEDFPVTYSDCIPGLVRFNREGTLTNSPTDVISTLANPMLAPVARATLRSVAVTVPRALTSAVGGGAGFELRVTGHNGRRFITPPQVTSNLQIVPGAAVMEVTGDIVVPALPVDTMVVLIVELLAIQNVQSAPLRRVVAYGNVEPYELASGDQAALRMRKGKLETQLRTGPGRWIRETPLMMWETGKGSAQAEPRPMMYCTLETGAEPNRAQVLAAQTSMISASHEEDAALLIQRNFRGYRARKSMATTRAMTAARARTRREAERRPKQSLADRGRAEEAALYARAAMSGGAGAQPLLAVLAAQQAQQLSQVSQMQEAQLAQLANMGDIGALNLVASQQQQQLAQLAAAMQVQLNQLAHALEALDDAVEPEEFTSDSGPEPPVVLDKPIPEARPPLSAAMQDARPDLAAPKATTVPLRPPTRLNDVDRMRDLPPSNYGKQDRLFAGGEPAAPSYERLGPSRATRAKLHRAGANEALPEEVRHALMNVAPADPAAPYRDPDLKIEGADVNVVSDVVVQLLAYQPNDTLNVTPDLKSLHFTFQFFDFPPISTERVALDRSHATDGERAPLAVLRRELGRGRVAQQPGLLYKFRVHDAENNDELAALERRMHFCRYLNTRALAIDVWDGESLLQHGTVQVDLRPMLRQGRPHTEVVVEVPVLDHRETFADEAARNRRRRAALAGASGEDNRGALSRGTLLLRLINIGRVDVAGLSNKPLDTRPQGAVVTMPGRLPKSKRVRVHAVPEQGGIVAQELLATSASPQLPTEGGEGLHGRRDDAQRANIRAALADVEERKLKRNARVREMRTGRRAGLEHKTDIEYALRSQMLSDIANARERKKSDLIKTKLREGLCAKRVLQPTYGETLFFEFEFTNPYQVEVVFKVTSTDSELQLVKSGKEWRALRRAAGLPSVDMHVEDDTLAGDTVLLMASETIKVPFKYQSLDLSKHADPKWANAGEYDRAGGEVGAEAAAMREVHHAARAGAAGKLVTVHVVAENDRRPAAVLEVDVRPRPVVVDRTFRFHVPEHEHLKQRLHVPPFDKLQVADAASGRRHVKRSIFDNVDETDQKLVVRASDASVVAGTVTSRTDGASPSDDVYFKVKTGGAPDARLFYLLAYSDKYMANLVETWQVYVHARRRVDISAVVGQSQHTSVVVRGGKTSRRVACFSSHPDELTVAPDTFMLVGGALTELLLAFRPLVSGSLDVMVHVVDVEARELVHAIVVSTDARAPTVSKAFEVQLRTGTVSHKKISYTNPYPTPRSFYVRSSHPALLRFRPERLDLGAGQSKPIGLTFEPGEEWGPGARNGCVDVLVFVNDEEDSNEETFKLRVAVVR